MEANQGVSSIFPNPADFETLLQRFFDSEYRENQFITLRLLVIFKAQPELFTISSSQFLEKILSKNTHKALLRNLLRICTRQDLPEAQHGFLYARALQLATSAKTDAAIKAYALKMLENFTRIYPDILPELRGAILPLLPFEKASFRARIKFLLPCEETKLSNL